MRFINSLAILSMAGLGLASPVAAGTDDLTGTGSGVTGSLGGLTSGLRLRNEEHKRYAAQAARRRQVFNPAEGKSEDALLRARGEGKDSGEQGGEGEAQGKDQSKPKGEQKGSFFGKGKGKDARHEPCLHPDDVDTLVAAYVRILSSWNDADAKYLADNFVDTSDSINILAGIPLGGPTFPTKEAFIEHQHTQPDNLPLVITHDSPVSCSEIALIWKATFGKAQKSVRGLTIIGATKDKGYWQIETIDVEFNSIAYLLDIGGTYTLPGQ